MFEGVKVYKDTPGLACVPSTGWPWGLCGGLPVGGGGEGGGGLCC